MAVKISIITPSFNQGQFLEETIQSVLSQDGDFFIDYIIADGGSTDNSVPIIKKYDELLKNDLYPVKCRGVNFRWWSKKDRGQYDAINQGFAAANGEIIAYQNSDDYYLPGAFAFIAKKHAENSEIDFFYGDIYFLYEPEKQEVLGKTEQGTYHDLTGFSDKGLSLFSQSVFFTKRILKEVGMLDESFNLAADYDLWIRMFKSNKVLYCNQVLAVFRIWTGAKTFSAKEEDMRQRKAVRKKNGMVMVDPKTIYKISSRLHFFRNSFPQTYQRLKKLTYAILNKIKY